ncbi:type VII secretion protein EccB [Mycobacterium sp. 1274761.0]|uniref:type VII secretion protein EccB n=1 Tax=Mycobacterium sp. 1274761.0 TaxID=1834077 RepID=UPI0008007197|nr:type VII secretion protein EccB [Mycobacterium sp. 1274761.0]OBK70469.1 type VII secretion protein EccB [Mycobacterium sp. 1274761.0]
MTRQPTTRLHVSGYRFLLRRMEHALLRGDLRMLHDPMRSQSLAFTAGCVLAVVVVAAVAILAFLRPSPGLGDAAIVMTRDSGALYVRVGDTWHPVMNLSSARLVAGSALTPRTVSGADVDSANRGPLLGIPGAPAVIGRPLSEHESSWTVCDDTTMTVIAGAVDLDRRDRQPSVLVTARSESAAATYLLYNGWRAEVDLRNPGVVWALRLDGVEPLPVSLALLEAIPEAPPIASPKIAGAGGPGVIAGFRVGDVIRVTRVDGNDYFVVLANGIQRIGEVAANLIRIGDDRNGITAVTPDVIADAPPVSPLAVSSFPSHAGQTTGAEPGVLCGQWLPDGPTTVLWQGDSLPVDGHPVELAQHDGEGPNVDGIVMPSGRSAYVRTTAITGAQGGGPLYVITENGVLYGLRDEATARVLGIEGDPVAAPWPVLSRLPRGPELSRDSALFARDSIPLPP